MTGHWGRAGLSTVLALTLIEPLQTPLVGDQGRIGRWVVLLGVYLAAFTWVALQPSKWPLLLGRPHGWVLLTGLWLLATSPFGLRPPADLALSFGFLVLAMSGAMIGATAGWAVVRDSLALALGTTLAMSAVAAFAGAVDDDGRWFGLFAHANGLGFAAATGVIIGVDRWARGRPSGLALLGLALPVLALTQSRTSILAMIAGLLVWAGPAVSRRALPAVMTLIVVGLAAGLATGTLSASVASLSRSGDAEEIVTVTGRSWVWSRGLDAWTERPVTGFGAASTTEVYEQVRAAEPLEGFDAETAHNLWLQLALSGGLVAVGAMAAATGGFAVRAFANPLRDRDAIVMALLVHGITEDVVREPRASLVLFAAALASSAHHLAGHHPALANRATHPSTRRRAWRSMTTSSVVTVRVVVCVPTLGRPESLDRLLAGLARQELQVDPTTAIDLSVVVVDNGPVSSAGVVARHAANLAVDLVAEPERGVSRARNAAVSHALARGADYLAFIDDDDTPEPDWLRRLLATALRFDAAGVGGPFVACRPEVDDGRPVRLPAGRPRRETGTLLDEAYASNLLLRRDAVEDLPGPFDLRFDRSGGEDVHLTRTLTHLGHRLVWCDEAIIHLTVTDQQLEPGLVLRRILLGSWNASYARRLVDGRRVPSLLHGAGLVGVGALTSVGDLVGRSLGRRVPGRREVARPSSGAVRMAAGVGWMLGAVRSSEHREWWPSSEDRP